jgi:hypothetical protein
MNKKKIAPPRETLVPKTIHFEGNKFDGLCDYYKRGISKE